MRDKRSQKIVGYHKTEVSDMESYQFIARLQWCSKWPVFSRTHTHTVEHATVDNSVVEVMPDCDKTLFIRVW